MLGLAPDRGRNQDENETHTAEIEDYNVDCDVDAVADGADEDLDDDHVDNGRGDDVVVDDEDDNGNDDVGDRADPSVETA